MGMKKGVDLSTHTTFNIGGKTKYFTEVKSIYEIMEVFSFAEEHNEDIFVIGGGSNLIVSDEGYNGIILKIIANKLFYYEDNRVKVESGMNLFQLIEFCINNGLAGIEKMAGIPGTIGGAIRGNAGAYRQEVKDVLKSVEVVTKEGKRIMKVKDCKFDYRDSVFKKYRDLIIFSAKFKFIPANSDELFKISQNIINKRKSIHPLEYPNAGSFFKNPIIKIDEIPEDVPHSVIWPINESKVKISAAWLIDSCDLKGYRIGNIGISKKHALFFINLGGGKSKDVIKLMEVVKERIFSKFGIVLDPEVEFLGF